jgi:hypothetical protein
MMVHSYNSSYTGGTGTRIMVQASPGKNHKTLSKKITNAERAGGVAQVVENLPSNHEVLS